jgi:hypothetical protein
MARFVDRLVQDGIDAPIDLIVDPTEGDLVDIRHRRLRHHWWAAYRAQDAVPKRSDLSAAFIDEILDSLIVVSNQDDTLRYEHYGRAIARAYGRDMTGRGLDEFPLLIAQMFRSIYRLCERQRVPVFMRHVPSDSHSVEHWLRLIVPLDDAGIRRITHFLVCNIPFRRDML